MGGTKKRLLLLQKLQHKHLLSSVLPILAVLPKNTLYSINNGQKNKLTASGSSPQNKSFRPLVHVKDRLLNKRNNALFKCNLNAVNYFHFVPFFRLLQSHPNLGTSSAIAAQIDADIFLLLFLKHLLQLIAGFISNLHAITPLFFSVAMLPQFLSIITIICFQFFIFQIDYPSNRT